MQLRSLEVPSLRSFTLAAVLLAACGGSGKNSGAGGTGGGTAGPIDGSGSNHCGVAAPLAQETGKCATPSAPAIASFDDYAGGTAASYTFPLGAARGALLHVGDGSDAGGESVIATEMVPGANGSGYALSISSTNSLHWGGLLMLYVQGDGVTAGCLDARQYEGIELSIKGSTPSGRFGVNVSLLDTTPVADLGLCTNVSGADCKDATTSFTLPADPESWTTLRVPWNAFTPGIGRDSTCVPLTGQNVVRLVIQPFMNYPPPDFTFQPGAYSLTVDDIAFYGTAPAGEAPSAGAGACTLPESLAWTGSAPVIAPPSDATHDLVAVKDPTIVRFNDRYHVYASSVTRAGAYNMVYTSFADFSEAAAAPVYHMDQTPGFNTYVAAPQLFYFTPQKKWYLVYQSGPPMYSTADDPGDPTSWTAPAPFYAATPALVTQNGGGWLDYWVICDDADCHLFFTNNQGHWYKSKTKITDFPRGFGDPVVMLQDSNSGRIFEASNVYKLKGTNRFLALVEAFDQTSANRRYFRSWLADNLEGPWVPWQASGAFPFAGVQNVTFDGSPWTSDISHGELVRAGYDEKLELDPCHMQFLIQGADPLADNMGDYNKIPWHLGLLTQSPP